MVVRVTPELSPRLVTVPASDGDEISAQDALDQMRAWEEYPSSMSFPRLATASGKDDLGGGTLTGINLQLQNAQMEFEANTTPLETGTVTTPDANGTTLTDSAATFVTNGVKRGDWIVNFTDQSVTSVLTVDSETQLTTKVLESGTDNDYDSADAYAVFGIVQKDLNGGNFTAVDTGGSPISSIYTSFGNQVVRTASVSATLQEQADIQFASFNGGVTIDVVNGASGTEFPTGTIRQPVDNLTDALSILMTRGFDTYFVIGDLTVDAGTHPYIFVGQSIVLSTITLDPAANILNAEFRNATVTGTLDGNATVKDCLASTLTMISGVLDSCLIEGTTTLGGGNDAFILDCWSGVPGTSTPVIDMGGTGQGLALRNYNGGMTITNRTGTDNMSIDLSSGQIVFDSTVNNGTIAVRGVGKLVDTSGDPIYSGTWNGVTVVNELTSSAITVRNLKAETFDGETFETIVNQLKSWGYGRFVETSEGVVDFYDNAGTAVLFTLTRTEAVDLTTRSRS